ncbi:unnamed protein product [Toxocara canis]|uniref:Transmembrane protein n=1 Tax=Toxocara canis TaxID=6265 RepID=A0A183VBH8_TOXCA|nr:unnamed protein product [Toxocara canis]
MADMVTVDGTMDMTDIWTGEWVAILAAVLTTTMVAQPLILCFFYVSPGKRARREGAICAAKQHDYYHAQGTVTALSGVQYTIRVDVRRASAALTSLQI